MLLMTQGSPTNNELFPEPLRDGQIWFWSLSGINIVAPEPVHVHKCSKLFKIKLSLSLSLFSPGVRWSFGARSSSSLSCHETA
jgi:hypothetical protein